MKTFVVHLHSRIVVDGYLLSEVFAYLLPPPTIKPTVHLPGSSAEDASDEFVGLVYRDYLTIPVGLRAGNSWIGQRWDVDVGLSQ